MEAKPPFNPDKPFEVADKVKPPFNPDVEYQELRNEPETSSLEAAKTGFFEGASAGLLDELAGGLEATGQAVGLAGMGAPTLEEFNLQEPKLLDPEALLNAYRTARDRRRSIIEQQRKDKPGAMLAGNLVGGVIGAPAIGGPALQGAVAGFGSSEADLTKGDIGQAALDTTLGAGLGYGAGKLVGIAPTATLAGAGGGAAIGAGSALLDENVTTDDVINKALTGGLIGAGVGAVGGSAAKGIGSLVKTPLSGTTLNQGFKEGLKGVNIESPEFGEDVVGKVNKLTSEVSDPILAQKQSEVKFIDDAKNLFEKQKQNTIKNFENNIDDLLKTQEEYKQAALARQTSEKRESFDKLSDLTGRIANDMDSKLTKTEEDIGKEIENIYEVAGDVFETPINLSEVVKNFVAELPSDKIIPKMQKALDLANGDVSLKQSKHLRDLFWSLKNDTDSNIRNASREGYRNINNQIQTDLANLNPDLGEALKLNNGKYSAISKVRDNFINVKDEVDSGIHGVLRKFIKANTTPNTIEESISKSQSKSQIQNLIDMLKIANPELAAEFETKGTDLAKQQLSTKAITPIAPTDNLPGQDKIKQLQEMISQSKASQFVQPNVDEKFSQFSNDPLSVAQKFMNYLEKGQDKKEGLALKKEMDTFLNDLTSTKGEEFTNQVKTQMQELSDQYKLYTPELKLTDVFTTPGIGRTALRSTAVIGNRVGRGINAISEAPIIKGITNVSKSLGSSFEKGALIGNNLTKHVSDFTINRLRTMPDPISQKLATMLDNIKAMPNAKQQAAIFALTQNPVYRNKLNAEKEK